MADQQPNRAESALHPSHKGIHVQRWSRIDFEGVSDLHVAIVGMGGAGSVAFLQLVHLGIRRITVIDGDCVSASNISRVLGATAEDAGRTWKVDVAVRYAWQLSIGTNVRSLRGHFGTDVLPADIEDCDLVLSCVDRHLPRALLNRLSYEKALPVIDMGSAFSGGWQR